MQTWPCVDDEQSLHAPPFPQALVASPDRQLPLWQQPFEQGLITEQTIGQLCVDGSQAIPGGQSPFTLQPQTPPMQTCPLGALEQSRQSPPLAPHAFIVPPPTQVPWVSAMLGSQQPPWHSWPGLQTSVH
jgi:hypothetical protein